LAFPAFLYTFDIDPLGQGKANYPMNQRRNEGEETFRRLLAFTSGQPAAERLAAQLLMAEGFVAVDPSHPLGGQDGLRDIICSRDGIRWIGAAYFPNGQQRPAAIKNKFSDDFAGVARHQVGGFAFVTNQELSLAKRRELETIGAGTQIELLHLERIATRLNSPACYGSRLEFLNIKMTKDEQVSFIAERDKVLQYLRMSFDGLARDVHDITARADVSVDQQSIAGVLKDIKEFQSILDSIASNNPYGFMQSPYFVLGTPSGGNVNRLHVPLKELKEFAELLNKITGTGGYTGLTTFAHTIGQQGHVNQLHVPLGNLQEYEERLDRIIRKLRELKDLESGRTFLSLPPSS
jgi:hypothetical protein